MESKGLAVFLRALGPAALRPCPQLLRHPGWVPSSVQWGLGGVWWGTAGGPVDYLSEGLATRCRWLGLVGMGGLLPRGGGICAGGVGLFTQKFFIS